MIHPNGTCTSPPTPASRTRACRTTVLRASARDSTTPSHPAQPTSTNSSAPYLHSRKRTCMGAPSSSRYTVSHRTRQTFAHSLLSQGPQINLSVHNLQSISPTQRQFNGYVFNVVLYPPGHFELLLSQLRMRAEESNLRHHRGGEEGEP